ncbi:hypothetical protein [Paraburkholderia sediminicola]|uniref:hypothetical protein n=1 Tax=Paraburkholderia sediminicola TaxID=458836 RepID=UPI0038BB4FAE
MRAADVLRELGRPIAYYPFLARYLGGVNAAVLFCQIFYWQDKAASEFGVHKTVDELEEETGLSYEEQRAARTKLRAAGVLIETAKRIEHRTYFRVDDDALELILSSPVPARKVKKVSEGTSEKSTSRNGKSPSREVGKVHSAKSEIPTPPNGENLARGEGDSHLVNGTETTAETTAAMRATSAVDKSPAAAAANSKDGPLNTEGELTNLLIDLERERGKDLTVDRTRDRVHVLTWVGKGVKPEQLRLAHSSAVAARKRDSDDRPTYAGFVSTFIDDALAPRPAAVAVVSSDGSPWFESVIAEVIDGKGAELGVRPRKPDEAIASYRVLVVNASREKSAVDFVLRDAKKFNDQRLYEFAVATFGDALMPTDFYA